MDPRVVLGLSLVDVGPVGPFVLCDRCGQPADARTFDVSTFAAPGAQMIVAICRTPECVNENGSPMVDPPDQPGQLTREDRRWIRRQMRLAEDLGRVETLLRQGV